MSFDSFKALLRYMYGSELRLSNGTVFTFLFASTHFKINLLEELCVDHINKSLGIENVCSFMDVAVNFESKILQEKCCEMFAGETAQIAEQKSFWKLSQPALSAFLDVDQTNIVEALLFGYVRQWMEQKCRDRGLPVNGTNMRQVIGDALDKIRFPTMTVQDFANSVATIEGLLTDKEENQVFKKITVFDNEDIECPFPTQFRCQISKHYVGFRDIGHLCGEKLLYHNDSTEKFNFNSLLKYLKDLPDGTDMFDPSFRLLLQCCADVANSSCISFPAILENQAERNELYDGFLSWQDSLNSKNISNIMSKYTELKKKVDKLYEWHI